MNSLDLVWIADTLGARQVRRIERIQSLWSGYGEIFRIAIDGAASTTAIVKHVKPPTLPSTEKKSPESRSHRRKCRSYDIEMTWYRGLAKQCDDACRVPKLLASRSGKDEWIFVLEDLDALGFTERRHDPSASEADACLAWLAAFHARFLGVPANGLWSAGTYWHLATRPDELSAIDDDALRAAAPAIDQKLAECTYRTLVHGDAKPANFCFGHGAVAAVDFQYVGGGCGMKDVAYFLAGDDLTEEREAEHLDRYFAHLRVALVGRGSVVDVDALEREWRALYPLAYADFQRFLAGWSKAHYRRDLRAQRRVRAIVEQLRTWEK